MFEKTRAFIIVSSACLALIALNAGTAQSQSGVKNVVWLQATTPGTSQSGHANLSGTMRAGQFIGNGAGLTGIAWSALTGVPAGFADGIDDAIAVTAGTGLVVSGNQVSVAIPFQLSAGTLSGGLISAVNTGNGIGNSGVRGEMTSTSSSSYGVFGVSHSPNGRAVFGFNDAFSGTAAGVYGRSNSNTGVGLFGLASDTTGVNYGTYGTTASPSGYGVAGVNTATTGVPISVYGLSTNGNGYAILGENNASSGLAYGVAGESNGTSGRGVIGRANAATGTTYGVYGFTQSTGGRAVRGSAVATSGAIYGGYFDADGSPDGIGVYGIGGDRGGVFESIQPDGYGVIGSAPLYGGFFSGTASNGTGLWSKGLDRGLFSEATRTTGVNYGVFATTLSPLGYGGYFDGPNTTAWLAGPTYAIRASGDSYFDGKVFATDRMYSTNGFSAEGTDPDIYGRLLPGGLGVVDLTSNLPGSMVLLWSLGNNIPLYVVNGADPATFEDPSDGTAVEIMGSLAVSGDKNFRIDHPSDPMNKWIVHYCTESKEPLNAYSGIVITDGKGYAWVELPDYFDLINKNPRVQLTIMEDNESEDFALAKVIGPIAGNGFKVRTNLPNIKVSWRVEALRNDPRERRQERKDIIEKPFNRRGKVYYPELYGLGPESKVGYQEKRSTLVKMKAASST